MSGPARADIFKHFAGQVRMDRAPGRIGFMSTQRRENRWQRTSCTGCAEQSGICRMVPRAPVRPARRLSPRPRTARPASSGRLATNSLQSDHRTLSSFGLFRRLRHGSPPSGPVAAAQLPHQQLLRSSFSPIPSPSGFARLHPTLPHVPAAKGCRTERYDGKGNLYLQHAA